MEILNSLFQAVKNENVPQIERLLQDEEVKVNLNYIRNKRINILNFAIKCKVKKEIISLLIANGCDVNIPRLYLPIQKAIKTKDEELFRLLIESNAMLDFNVINSTHRRNREGLSSYLASADIKLENIIKPNIRLILKTKNVKLINTYLDSIDFIDRKKYKSVIETIINMWGECHYDSELQDFVYNYKFPFKTILSIIVKVFRKYKVNSGFVLHEIIHSSYPRHCHMDQIYKLFVQFYYYLVWTEQDIDER